MKTALALGGVIPDMDKVSEPSNLKQKRRASDESEIVFAVPTAHEAGN